MANNIFPSFTGHLGRSFRDLSLSPAQRAAADLHTKTGVMKDPTFLAALKKFQATEKSVGKTLAGGQTTAQADPVGYFTPGIGVIGHGVGTLDVGSNQPGSAGQTRSRISFLTKLKQNPTRPILLPTGATPAQIAELQNFLNANQLLNPLVPTDLTQARFKAQFNPAFVKGAPQGFGGMFKAGALPNKIDSHLTAEAFSQLPLNRINTTLGPGFRKAQD